MRKGIGFQHKYKWCTGSSLDLTGPNVWMSTLVPERDRKIQAKIKKKNHDGLPSSQHHVLVTWCHWGYSSSSVCGILNFLAASSFLPHRAAFRWIGKNVVNCPPLFQFSSTGTVFALHLGWVDFFKKTCFGPDSRMELGHAFHSSTFTSFFYLRRV